MWIVVIVVVVVVVVEVVEVFVVVVVVVIVVIVVVIVVVAVVVVVDSSPSNLPIISNINAAYITMSYLIHKMPIDNKRIQLTDNPQQLC